MNDLVFKSACELRQLILNRELSSHEVVSAHVDQIQRFNKQVNVVVTECFDQALNLAREQDQSDQWRNTLAGLPIAHKDLASTAGIRTTFGSTLFRDHVPESNDYIVDRMQQAGCVTIGKTNTPEFGAGSHTFNRVFGVSRNPYDLSRTCGGSSGGPAGALAMRMMPLADGGDYGGSLRNPGAFCNVIGFRPTNNQLPPRLDSDTTLNLSSLGPMARCIDDIFLLLGVLTDSHQPELAPPAVEPYPLEGLKIAVSTDLGGLPVVEEIQSTVTRAVKELSELGADVTEDQPNLEGARDVFHTLRAWSFRNRYTNLSAKEKVELKPTILWNLALGESLTPDDLERAQETRVKLRQNVDSFFDKYDLFIAPTTQVLPFPVEVEWIREINGVQMETYIDWMESCSLITPTECPALSMPAGFTNGLPVGIQLIAPRNADYMLLRIAKSIEAVLSSASTLPPLLCGN